LIGLKLNWIGGGRREGRRDKALFWAYSNAYYYDDYYYYYSYYHHHYYSPCPSETPSPS